MRRLQPAATAVWFRGVPDFTVSVLAPGGRNLTLKGPSPAGLVSDVHRQAVRSNGALASDRMAVAFLKFAFANASVIGNGRQ